MLEYTFTNILVDDSSLNGQVANKMIHRSMYRLKIGIRTEREEKHRWKCSVSYFFFERIEISSSNRSPDRSCFRYSTNATILVPSIKDFPSSRGKSLRKQFERESFYGKNEKIRFALKSHREMKFSLPNYRASKYRETKMKSKRKFFRYLLDDALEE